MTGPFEQWLAARLHARRGPGRGDRRPPTAVLSTRTRHASASSRPSLAGGRRFGRGHGRRLLGGRLRSQLRPSMQNHFEARTAKGSRASRVAIRAACMLSWRRCNSAHTFASSIVHLRALITLKFVEEYICRTDRSILCRWPVSPRSPANESLRIPYVAFVVCSCI